MGEALRKIRGRIVEIDVPEDGERDWIFAALQDPLIHVPMGCKEAPPRARFDAGLLQLHRGPEVREEAVRFHMLRKRSDGSPVGFFLDFGWDYPTDATREIDLAFPDPAQRSIAAYVDATVIVSQYLFVNHLAKRVRWRVEMKRGQSPRRGERQGARLLQRFDERHPVTGDWITKCIYEYAVSDFEALYAAAGVDPWTTDYGDMDKTVWDMYREGRLT